MEELGKKVTLDHSEPKRHGVKGWALRQVGSDKKFIVGRNEATGEIVAFVFPTKENAEAFAEDQGLKGFEPHYVEEPELQ